MQPQTLAQETDGTAGGVNHPAVPPVRVTYRLNPDDLYAAQWHYVQTSPSIRRTYRTLFAATLALVTALIALLPLTGAADWLFSLILALTFVAVWTWKWPAACRDGVRRQVGRLLKEGRNSYLQGEFCMEVCEDGLRLSSGHGESRLAWDAVESVDETDAHVFFRIGSTAQYAVPKWAFENKGRAEEFVTTARHFQRRAEFS